MIEELEKEIPDMENGINASRNLFSQSQKLDAIIISHDDEDHNGGILELIKQNSPLIGENTKFIIQGGKFNGKDEVYPTIRDFVTRNVPEASKSQTAKDRIIFAYNKIGSDIWDVLGEEVPEGAPNIQLVSSDGSFRGDESIDLHDVANRRELAMEEDDNHGSIVSIISMGNFRYYTAGDFERNKNLIEYLQLKEQANGVQYFPIQAFLVPHHGSTGHLNKHFVKNLEARAAIISHGNVKFGGSKDTHPTEKTMESLYNSDLDFIYLTNPKIDKDDDSEFITDGLNFVVAGEDGKITSATSSNRTPKGTIKVQTYSNIAEAEKEKFLIKYKKPDSKVRDYYKDKDFAELNKELLDIIRGYDEEFADGKGELRIDLSESDLKYFLDEDGKVKHINPTTLKNFFDNYNQESSGDGIYSLSITFDSDVIGFQISSNFYHQDESKKFVRKLETQEKARSFYDGIKQIGTVLDDYVGFYFDDLSEVLNDGKLISITNSDVFKSRKEDKRQDGKYFLEVKEPKAGETTVAISIWEQKEKALVKKEYHKDARKSLVEDSSSDSEEKSESFTSKVVARRIEYGTKEDRTI